MARITIDASAVNIDLSTMDKVWAVHGSLHIPLAHVTSARAEDEDAWQHLLMKIIGTNAPGLKMAGTYAMDGGLAFLDYGSGRNCLVLETAHETYKTVIVQPDAGQEAKTLAEEIGERLTG